MMRQADLPGRITISILHTGAEAFKRDNSNAQVRFLNTGHFAIETHGKEIAAGMLEFLNRSIKP